MAHSGLQIKPEDCSPLGRLILARMEEKGWSMREMARQTGLTQPGIRAACFKGTRPKNRTLQKLSKVLCTSPEELDLYIDSHKPTNEDEYYPQVQQSMLKIYEALLEGVEQLPESLRPKNEKLLAVALETAIAIAG